MNLIWADIQLMTFWSPVSLSALKFLTAIEEREKKNSGLVFCLGVICIVKNFCSVIMWKLCYWFIIFPNLVSSFDFMG